MVQFHSMSNKRNMSENLWQMLVLTNYGIVYFKSSCSICHFFVIIKLVLVPGQQARGKTHVCFKGILLLSSNMIVCDIVINIKRDSTKVRFRNTLKSICFRKPFFSCCRRVYGDILFSVDNSLKTCFISVDLGKAFVLFNAFPCSTNTLQFLTELPNRYRTY